MQHSIPDNTDAICVAVRDIISHLHETTKSTFAEIAKKASDVLSEPTIDPVIIKVFLEKKTSKVNKNNKAFPLLYNYIRADFQNFPDTTRAKVLDKWHVLVPDSVGDSAAQSVVKEMERTLGITFKNWLEISDKEINKLCAKLFGDYSGDYVLLRKSAHHANEIVKSRLRIDRSVDNTIPKVRHFHHDRLGVERISTGIILPMVSNVYAILEVENGEGLEFIALRNPIQWHFKKMLGFMISMNMDRNILSARIFIERDDTIWDGIGPRFKVDDKTIGDYIKSIISLLDKGTSATIPDTMELYDQMAAINR